MADFAKFVEDFFALINKIIDEIFAIVDRVTEKFSEEA